MRVLGEELKLWAGKERGKENVCLSQQESRKSQKGQTVKQPEAWDR